MENEFNAKPISVVAPTNSSMKTNTRGITNDSKRISIPSITAKTSAMKISSGPINSNEPQTRATSQTRTHQLQRFEETEPTSVSVSKWLQNLPDNNAPCSNTNQASNLSNKRQNATEASPMFDENKPLIKEIDVGGCELHIFNLYEQPYVISAEVSSLFPKWKKKDHLSKMIKLKKLNIQSIEISNLSEGHETFFEQCLIEDVGGIESKDGDLVDSVTLYPMKSIKSMLTLFGSSGGLSQEDISRLSKAIEKECDSFDPDDEFWTSIV